MTKIFKTLASATALMGIVTILPTTALADGPTAIAKAAQHAGLAAGSGDLAGVQRHLHHSLNCLVGPDGEGFDESAGNPCAADGGAIPQTSDAELRAKLMAIAAEVRGGVMGTDVDAAKRLATETQEMLAD
jgi:hypothetical protein